MNSRPAGGGGEGVCCCSQGGLFPLPASCGGGSGIADAACAHEAASYTGCLQLLEIRPDSIPSPWLTCGTCVLAALGAGPLPLPGRPGTRTGRGGPVEACSACGAVGPAGWHPGRPLLSVLALQESGHWEGCRLVWPHVAGPLLPRGRQCQAPKYFAQVTCVFSIPAAPGQEEHTVGLCKHSCKLGLFPSSSPVRWASEVWGLPPHAQVAGRAEGH